MPDAPDPAPDASNPQSVGAPLVVLNAGAGPQRAGSLHPCFSPPGWREIRFDIDPAVEPDVLGSVKNLRQHFREKVFDAIWSSHNLEHLYQHEAPGVLAEFGHILKDDGFVIITCPDLESIAELLLSEGLGCVAYEAPAGKITVHDMLFGHGTSIAAGNHYMAHRTGFTQERLGEMAAGSGFRNVRVGRGKAFDLWAILPMPDCDEARLRSIAQGTNLEFLFSDATP